jgi:hypothetical protein
VVHDSQHQNHLLGHVQTGLFLLLKGLCDGFNQSARNDASKEAKNNSNRTSEHKQKKPKIPVKHKNNPLAYQTIVWWQMPYP